MLKRIAEVCFRRRRRVLVVWIFGIVVLGAVMGVAGSGYSSDFTLPDVESKRGIDILDDHFGGQGAGQIGNLVFEADDGIEDPGGSPGDRAVPRRGRPDRRRPVADQPVRRGQRGADLRSRRRRRADRLRRVRGPIGCLVRGDRGDRRRHPGGDARGGRSAHRARWSGLRRVRGAVVGGARNRLRHRHPDHRLRFGDGDGPADRCRPRRDRVGLDHHRPALQRRRHAGLHVDDRDHDRSRRGHRLRLVHRHPVPREPARGSQHRAVDARRDEHGRPRRRVRRLDRCHLAAGHADHAAELRVRNGDRHGCRRGDDARCLTHPAPGPARLRR